MQYSISGILLHLVDCIHSSIFGILLVACIQCSIFGILSHLYISTTPQVALVVIDACRNLS